jgi:hypothetical protein
MALGPSPVADAARDREGGVVTKVAMAALACLVLTFGGAGAALDVDTDAYRGALRSGAVGTISGRAAAEPRKLDGPETPLTGVEIVLVPRSPAFRQAIERVKLHARDSQASYLAAASELRKAQAEFEQEFHDIGAAQLVRGAKATGEGVFGFEGVPAGPWLILGRRQVTADKHAKETKTKKERGRDVYLPTSPLTGITTVTFWVLELDVVAGGAAVVHLNDRNTWFTGIEERRGPGAGR